MYSYSYKFKVLFIFLFFSTCRFFVVFFVCVPFFIWMFFLFIYLFTFIHLFFFSKLISAKNFIDKEDNYQFLEHDTPFFKYRVIYVFLEVPTRLLNADVQIFFFFFETIWILFHSWKKSMLCFRVCSLYTMHDI